VKIVINSSLLEIRTWPKPGNVHKTHNFPTTTYEDFLQVAYKSSSMWKSLLIATKKQKLPPSTLYVEFLDQAVKQMMRVQNGGNVLLGHYLLMIPLFISAVTCSYISSPESVFWDLCRNLINESSPRDTIVLYRALQIAQPGGMGSRKKYDIYQKNYQVDLINDQVNLAKIFDLSKTYDGISMELASNYSFIRELVLPKFKEYIDEYEQLDRLFPSYFFNNIIREDVVEMSEELNELLLRVFLFILSNRNDTLISRKTDLDHSKIISDSARNIIEKYHVLSKHEWMSLVKDFDNDLHKADGKLNPGTTADLLAASIFCFLIKTRLF